jgi:isoamylase
VLPNPPVLWDIESDPVLAGTKLIAEAWDAAGLYQVGSFVGDSWREWNGRFRDDARCFLRGDGGGAVRRFADRLVGSPDMYRHKDREPEQTINFITCHDGFSLNDLVSYDRKHNERNGECNRDGGNDNFSWNHGVEGPSEDPPVESLRNRQVKNFLVATMLSVGVPMILMGDEVRRTQRGNNNDYCHDDAENWFDWDLCRRHADVYRFAKLLIERRLRRPIYHEQERLTLSQLIAGARKQWHGTRLNHPDWGDDSHTLALTVEVKHAGFVAHIIFNAFHDELEFELPPVETSMVAGNPWRRWIDTSRASPEDITAWHEAPPVHGGSYRVGPRSPVVFFSEMPGAPA